MGIEHSLMEERTNRGCRRSEIGGLVDGFLQERRLESCYRCDVKPTRRMALAQRLHQLEVSTQVLTFHG